MCYQETIGISTADVIQVKHPPNSPPNAIRVTILPYVETIRYYSDDVLYS